MQRQREIIWSKMLSWSMLNTEIIPRREFVCNFSSISHDNVFVYRGIVQQLAAAADRLQNSKKNTQSTKFDKFHSRWPSLIHKSSSAVLELKNYLIHHDCMSHDVICSSFCQTLVCKFLPLAGCPGSFVCQFVVMLRTWQNGWKVDLEDLRVSFPWLSWFRFPHKWAGLCNCEGIVYLQYHPASLDLLSFLVCLLMTTF